MIISNKPMRVYFGRKPFLDRDIGIDEKNKEIIYKEFVLSFG